MLSKRCSLKHTSGPAHPFFPPRRHRFISHNNYFYPNKLNLNNYGMFIINDVNNVIVGNEGHVN